MAFRYLRRALLVVVPAALLIGGLAAAYALDDPEEGRVGRNVTVAGRPVGGMSEEQLAGVVQQVAARFADARVEVKAPGGGFTTDTRAMGVAVQVEPTVEAAMGFDRRGSALDRFGSWLRSFLGARPAPLRLSVDAAAVHKVVSSQDPGPRRPPREPTIREQDGRLRALEGAPGNGIDPADVIDKLPDAASRGLPITVEVDRGSVDPRFSMDDAARLAREGEELTASGLDVKAASQEATVPPATLRSWLRSMPTDAGLQLTVDAPAAAADLSKLLTKTDPPPKDASFTVVGDQVSIVPGQPGLGCCADAAGEVAGQAVISRVRHRVDLPLKEVEPEVTAVDLSLLGIKELVGTFTTNHAAGQSRVNNIHLIADMVRGQIIKPGETFSINRLTGERTKEKGFVVAPVIEEGKFEDSVGGGVSQFATTMFNAAFFAGLDIPEYQSHSIYISRYPYGREATLSYPKPDLVLRNPSPYAVLVWTSYTDRSITVSMFSSKWVESVQTAQTSESRGGCKLVRTERTRTVLADRSTMVDRVNALYRPGEGVKCT
ncbi:MAG TPA: VanW family protein [Actinomycetota bacterium]|nr:VanW family protein [Actinomycetota bacterium]